MIINNNGGVAGNTHNKILFGVVGGQDIPTYIGSLDR